MSKKTPFKFRTIFPDLGARFRIKKPKEELPIRIFYGSTPIGLILVKPNIQVQIKGKKLDIKPQNLEEVREYLHNNFDTITNPYKHLRT